MQNARVRLSGELDGGVAYLFQSNFGSLLDLRLSWSASPGFTVDGGLYKTPFSGEFLIPAGSTELVSRARIVNALRPGRQVGVQVRGRVADGRLEYRAGAFNGPGGPGGNDDEHFVYGVRLAYERPIGGEAGGVVTVGVSGSTSDEPARVSGAAADALRFTGADRLLGVDIRVSRGRWLGTAEWIGADPDDDAPGEPEPVGWQTTVGFLPNRNGQALLRWDAIRPGIDGIGDSDLMVLGYNHAPTGATRLQANVEVPVRRGGDPRLRLLAQLHF